MKRTLLSLISLFILIALNTHGHQVATGTAEVMVAGKWISIQYGVPELRGRDMVARAKPGMVWRMGADHATSIRTEADLVFGDTVIPKGSYSLFAKYVEGDKWELLFNSKTGIWGTNHDPEMDVAAVPLNKKTLENSAEKFSITLKEIGPNSGQFSMSWGSKELTATFSVN